jgi:hypothetical protein
MFSMRWMKILCFLFLISHVSVNSIEPKNVIDHYQITLSDNPSIFNTSRDQESIGYIEKIPSILNIFFNSREQENYYSYDHLGGYNGTSSHTKHIFSITNDCFDNIYIYNKSGQLEGEIRGDNLYPFEFDFINALGKQVAWAKFRFDDDQSQIKCLLQSDSDDSDIALSTYTRNRVDVVIYRFEEISAQMIETFATFMCQQCTNFQLEESMSTDLDLISK